MSKKRKPTCFVIAGPNGAGKTTFALRYLPQIAGCRNFVNADLIAHGLSPLDSLSAQYEAGRLFLREIYANIEKREDFAFEATVGRSSCFSCGYRMLLFHEGGFVSEWSMEDMILPMRLFCAAIRG